MNPRRYTISSTDGISGVKNLNTFVLDFSVVYLAWSEFRVFLWF